MLFNSYVFIFAFLPIAIIGFFRIGKYNQNLALFWLVAASIFFYGYWNPAYVGLILGSIVCNYTFGTWIAKAVIRKKHVLVFAISANLLLLSYYKYANFFLSSVNSLADSHLSLGDIILPLGISFFTFTQIAYLMDTYHGKVKEYNFVHYVLFVTYFPHLIAGPILHHQEMMPQFAKRAICHVNWNNVAVGLAIFVLGLTKKLLLADNFGEIAKPIFDAVAMGGQPTLFIAWIGPLAYTLQLYFDFSAYSDMAIGLSLMFNVRLPMNFDSPYKATSIIEFWRRWHMTLSRFLRDYLYIPLGGSRNGKSRRYVNLMITMLLGGLWHGAGWTFIIWGGLHGFYLMVNHAWRGLKLHLGWTDGGGLNRIAAVVLTFIAVVVGWVFFRAENISSAIRLIYGMAGLNGVSQSRTQGMYSFSFALLCIGFAITWLLPNVRQIFLRYRPTCEDIGRTEQPHISEDKFSNRMLRFLEWRPTTLQGVFYGVLFFIAIIHLVSTNESEFLYYQF